MPTANPISRNTCESAAPGYVARWLDSLACGKLPPVAIAVLLAAVAAAHMARSLWVDEAGTFWMAHEGMIRAIQKTLHWPGQSVLYSVIASFFCFDGRPFRDVLLRVPSLIGLVVGAYFLYRIAESLVGRGTGLAAMALYLFHPSVMRIGFQARPYALAMASVIASCWALIEWDRSRSRLHLVYYVIASTFIIYLHYIHAVIFLVQVLYLGVVFVFEGRRKRGWEIVGAGAAVLLLAAPLISHVELLIAKGQTLEFAPIPSLLDLADSLAPSPLLLRLMLAGIPLAFAGLAAPGGEGKPRPASGVLMAAWWLSGPVIFFLVSRLSLHIFVLRYFAFTLPAQSLLFTYCGYRLFGAPGARIWALLGALFFAVGPLIGADTGEELLPMIQIVRSEAKAPVFFPSLLVESLSSDWRAGNRPGSYLFAPLVAYPIPNEVYPLPFGVTADAKAYISSIVDSRLAGKAEVLFVDKDEAWPWIVDRMSRAGLHPEIRNAGRFKVLVFRR